MATDERAIILDEAKKCVCADRDIQYGTPENSFAEIAKLWSAYLDKEITAHDVGIMMCIFKIARIKTGHVKRDNYVDAAGYIACAGECQCEEREEIGSCSKIGF